MPTRNHHAHRNLVHAQDAQLNGERQDFDYARALRKQLLFPPMWLITFRKCDAKQFSPV